MNEDDGVENVEILGTHNVATDGPFKASMSVLLIGVEGEYEGYDAWAEIDLPVGMRPSDEKLEEMLACALEQAPGFRLATRKEFMQRILAERTGADVNFSVPGPTEFRLKAKVDG